MNILTKSIITLTALAAAGLHAEVFPIAEDTFGTISKNTILKASGAAKSITVSAKTKAYIGFDVGGSGIPASAVTNARLTVYVARATKTGTLFLANATGAFSETFPDKSIPMPTDAIISTTALSDSSSREFVTFDVTNQVKDWLTSPSSEHGFVLAADGTLSLTIATKEGAGTGHPAVLEVDVSNADASGNFIFSGGNVGIGTNSPGSLLQVGEFGGAGDRYVTVASQGGNTQRSGIKLRHFDDAYGFTIESDERGNPYGLNFLSHFADATGISRFFIDIDGNVGIGTTAPGAKLEISNGTTTLQIRPGELNGVTNASAITLEYPGNGTIGIQDSLDVDQQLNVRGDYYGFGHVYLFAFEGENNSGTAYLQARDNSGTSSIGLQLRTQTNGSIVDTMFLAPSGSVGIGTTSPGGTLDVALPDVAGGINSHIILREDGGTAGVQVTGGTTEGVLRMRHRIEVWPNAAGTEFGRIDVRNSAGTAQVTINGDGTVFKPGGGSWAVLSDARLKHNIEPLTGALDSLLRLRSVTYEYNDPSATQQPAGKQTGFIAQEVEKVFPGWVGEKTDGYKFINISGFESLTVQSLRELRAEKDAEIAALKAELAALKATNTALKTGIAARLAKLEAAAASTVNTTPVNSAAIEVK